MFKSVLGAASRTSSIEQAAAVREMHAALKPGGRLLFAENLRESLLHTALRRFLVPWGSSWRYVALAEMRSYLVCFASADVRTCGVSAALGRTERQQRLLAAIDRRVLDLVTPPSWHYVVYGVAQK